MGKKLTISMLLLFSACSCAVYPAGKNSKNLGSLQEVNLPPIVKEYKAPNFSTLKTGITVEEFSKTSGFGKPELNGDCSVVKYKKRGEGEKLTGTKYEYTDGGRDSGIQIQMCVIKTVIVSYTLSVWNTDRNTGLYYDTSYNVDDYPLIDAVEQPDFRPGQRIPPIPALQNNKTDI